MQWNANVDRTVITKCNRGGVVMSMSANKSAGLALIVGVILSAFSFVLFPGGLFVSPVDHNNFPEAIEALAEYAALTHVLTMVMMLSLFLEGYGLFALTRIRSTPGGLAGFALRFGVFGMLFSYGALVLGLGARHMVVHVVAHGVTGDPASAAVMGSPDLALAIYTAGAATYIAFLSISSLAGLLLGFGLAAHFATLNIYKLAAYGCALVGAGGLANLLFTQHFHDAGLAFMAVVSSIVLMVGALWLIVLGIGFCKGIPELEAEKPAEPVGV